jgi:ABC-type multidrug transport system ATPase subunit
MESVHNGSSSACEVPVAYVAQDTAFFSNLTVWETVLLAAKLRSAAPEKAVEEQTKALLTRLGLTDCIHTRVGGDTGGRMVTGISGGEKRRLAIACELAGSSSGEAGILVADEPTSGLDAFQADLVVAKLNELAVSSGSVVLFSLHQPRATSMDRVDDLLLLAPGGGVAYIGPLEGCLPHFESMGFSCPLQHSIAEFAVDLVSIDNSSEATQETSRHRIAKIVKQWKLKQGGSNMDDKLPQEPPQVTVMMM